MITQGKSNIEITSNSEITFDLFPTVHSKSKLKKHKSKLLNSIQSLFVSRDICEEPVANLEKENTQKRLKKIFLIALFFWLSFIIVLIIGLTINIEEELTPAQWVFLILLSVLCLVFYVIQLIYSVKYFADFKRYFSEYDANKTFETAKNAPMYLEFRMYYQISVNGQIQQYYQDQKLYPEESVFLDRVYSFGKKSKLKIIENFYLLDEKSIEVLNSKLNTFVEQNKKRTSKQFTGCQVILESEKPKEKPEQEKPEEKQNLENKKTSTTYAALYGLATGLALALPMLTYIKYKNPQYTLYLIKGVSFL